MLSNAFIKAPEMLGKDMEWAVRTRDGRTLAVEDAGDPVGRVVLVHGGAPNSRYLYGPNVADAASRGLRLVSYDRPGYGGSTPHPGHSVADGVGNVRAICAVVPGVVPVSTARRLLLSGPVRRAARRSTARGRAR
jgi:pimeloyl-ACP methyl ester carboxylesterase